MLASLSLVFIVGLAMGAVLGAVSPAVVIPRMVALMEKKYGTEKAIPQMVMAGASCDDIFVIVLGFSFLLSAVEGWMQPIKGCWKRKIKKDFQKIFWRKVWYSDCRKKKMTGVSGDDQKSNRRRFVAHRRNFCV